MGGVLGQDAAEATTRLVETSRLRDASAVLSRDDLEFLLADPVGLESETARREDLRARTGSRYLLVGQSDATKIREFKQYVVYLPIPLVYVILVVPLPITYGEKTDVPHGSIALRLVDLETGRIEGEFFEIFHDEPSEVGIDAKAAKRGLESLGLAGSGG